MTNSFGSIDKTLVKPSFADCREDYDAAMRGLAENPDDSTLQYTAVLALARAGSLDQAQADYERFKLDQYTDNEDYLSLGGRLLKDASLRADRAARDHLAAKSAERYQNAFDRTGGFYSGINSATMTLLAGGEADDVNGRAKQVLSSLPDLQGLSDQDAYFVLATRSEALLLLNELAGSQQALIEAWERDPLNYTNHAATLRQLSLICRKRRQDSSWIATFAPPKAVHFAGQMFSIDNASALGTNISGKEELQLRDQIIHLVQEQDIGFFFGALSAGFDLLSAEVVLEEGGEVHVVLPVEVSRFCKASVVPFGNEWRARFEVVMQQASSVEVIAPEHAWIDRSLNRHSASIAMGKAILKANLLSAQKAQVIAFVDSNADSFTRDHKDDWQKTGNNTIELKIPGHYQRRLEEDQEHSLFAASFIIHDLVQSKTDRFSDVLSAARHAISRSVEAEGSSCIAFVSDQQNAETESDFIEMLSEKALPGSTLVSEHFACLLAAQAEAEFSINYIGKANLRSIDSPGVYSLSLKM